ncbi:MAG: HD domain-containing protein [Chloroflexi bacterium]|nr:HD domain-containing protein [Chloroflexota bacterium]
MLKGFHVPLFDLVMALSSAVDLVTPQVGNHHKRVAYIAHAMGGEMGLTNKEQKDLLLAGALHDIGALSLKERLDTLQFEIKSPHIHAETSYLLLKNFEPFADMAYLGRFHHVPWNEGEGVEFRGNPVPIGSHILHLADRIEVLIDKNKSILGQTEGIAARIFENSRKFAPNVLEAFKGLVNKEYFWLDTVSGGLDTTIRMRARIDDTVLDMEDLFKITEVFSQVIDFRSPFTATHSSGVAAISEALAGMMGLSELECRKIRLAGYLHDLGKLAVPTEILEKPDKLTEEEFNIMRSHTFYTYRILEPLDALDEINTWASFHHERLDGNGYPFHLGARDLPIGSRIMAVADVFTAITENRPYREGMPPEQALKLLKQFADNSALDVHIVSLMTRNFDVANQMRIDAQKEATAKYQEFSKGMILK